MKPFNLEEALQGKPVVTRDGRKVQRFIYLSEASDSVLCKIIVIVDGSWYDCYDDGRRNKYIDSGADLFMASEKREYWVNVYRTYKYGGIVMSCVYDSKEMAINYIKPKNTGDYLDYLTTVKVWEEEI